MTVKTYRMGQIPAGLATVTMLRRQRRRLADGQKPVARLFYHGNKYTDLWRIADSVPMRPMTAKQRAAFEAAAEQRVCQVCGKEADQALHTTGQDTDERLRRCDSCERERRLGWMRHYGVQRRVDAATWAAEVLADPNTVILDVAFVAVRQPDALNTVKTLAARAVSLIPARFTGAFGPRINYTLIPQERPTRLRDLPAGGTPIADVAADIRTRIARPHRLVTWADPYSLDRDLRHAISAYGTSRDHPALQQDVGYPYWTMSRRYSEWVGEIDPHATTTVAQPRPVGEPAEVAEWILRTLRRMAATAPDGGTSRA